MNALASKFGDGFSILAFPCNQFGHQTQEDNSEILSMLKHVRPGGGFTPAAQVTMFEKVNVNGATAHPLFAWLRSQILLPMDSMASVHEAGMPDPLKMVSARASDGNSTLVLWTPVTRSDIAWNFEKFLIDGDGMCVKRYSQFYPTIDIAADIEKLLQADEAEGVVKPTTP